MLSSSKLTPTEASTCCVAFVAVLKSARSRMPKAARSRTDSSSVFSMVVITLSTAVGEARASRSAASFRARRALVSRHATAAR